MSKPKGQRLERKLNAIKKRGVNQIAASGQTDKDLALVKGRMLLRPTVQAAFTLKECSWLYKLVAPFSLADALAEQTRLIIGGNLDRAEGMLTAQAHTLDCIFNSLARQASNAESMDHHDLQMKLALRAQALCRATWETLAAMKNPPLMGYVRQANIAHGPQQVNNAPPVGNSGSGAGEYSIPKSKLLEEKDGERLDFGATRPSVEVDSEMATLGEVDGAKVC